MELKKKYSKAIDELKAKNYDAALKLLHKIRTHEKDYYYLEANIYSDLKNYVKELQALKKLLPLLKRSLKEDRKTYEECLINIGNTYSNLGLLDEGFKLHRQVIENTKDKSRYYRILTSICYEMNFKENVSPADLHALYDEYRNSLDFEPFPRRLYEHDKIRVGFLSGDFYNHVVMKWSWALFTNLNRDRFEIYCYSNSKEADQVTAFLRQNVNGWRDIREMTDEAAANLIRDDEIDILIDLGGKTESARPNVLAYRPATIQIALVGMDSSGFKTVDYFVTDEIAFGDSAPYFTENFIILSTPHICYHPFGVANIEIEPEPPCLKNGYVTFGSFNQYKKITDSMLATWKKILDAVPNSRLLLKNKMYDVEDNREFVANRLKRLGFDLERVEFRGYSIKHPRDYNDMDIALDTFPYTGVTTTAEALYMGVPVVSRYADRHGTRIGLCILTNVGLGELAVDNYDDYVKRAVMLASDGELLSIFRKNLRTMIEKSPIMDAKVYTHELERAFIEILNAARNPDFSSEQQGAYSLLLRREN